MLRHPVLRVHNAFPAGPITTPIAFAVIPLHSGCDAPGPQTLALTASIQNTAHELIEIATDPIVNTGYVDRHDNEVVDECYTEFGATRTNRMGARYNQVLGGDDYLLEEVWSDQAGTCQTASRRTSVAHIVAPSTATTKPGQRFSVNVSGDPSRARSFQWQFASPSGTPSTVAPKGATARIHFPSPGRYVLWVTITDAAGNQTTAVRTVKVVGAPVG